MLCSVIQSKLGARVTKQDLRKCKQSDNLFKVILVKKFNLLLHFPYLLAVIKETVKEKVLQ